MYSHHRFPSEIISYGVWLYYTFPLSYRDIEKMMLYRGIEVTYETMREWCQKFGQQHANQLQRKRPYVSDKWHLDEMVVTIKKQHTICGGQWTVKGTCWMSCCNAIEIRRQQSDSSVSC